MFHQQKIQNTKKKTEITYSLTTQRELVYGIMLAQNPALYLFFSLNVFQLQLI